MIGYVRKGWEAASRQPFLFVTLFLYRFGWGFALYSLAQSVMLPLLHRFPGRGVSSAQTHLFLAEGQFQLMKTDLSHSYLWLLLSLLAVRMVLTPLLNAGIFYSLRHTDLNSGYRFFKGIKEMAKPFFGYYLIQMLFTLAPLYFLYPQAIRIYREAHSYQGILLDLLPWIGGWLAYVYVIRLFFLFVQFGKVWSEPFGRTLGIIAASLFAMLGVALLLLLLALAVSAAALTASMIWAGMWALVLFQAYRFVDTFISLWSIASQHELYYAKL